MVRRTKWSAGGSPVGEAARSRSDVVGRTSRGFRSSVRRLLLLGGLLVLGCLPSSPTYRGTVQPLPAVIPDVTLSNPQGERRNLAELAASKVTVVFVGYTHCPDICPIHMATLTAAVDQISPELVEDLQVWFITADPERDTPERLDEWMASFSPRFEALRGTREEVNALERSLRLPESILGDPMVTKPSGDGAEGSPDASGEAPADDSAEGPTEAGPAPRDGSDPTYEVMHSGRMIVFDRSTQGYLSHSFTAQIEDWVNDLTLILRDGFDMTQVEL